MTKTTALTAREARKALFPLLARISEDYIHVEITSKHGSAVLMSLDEFEALQETAYLLRSPADARRLIESLAQLAEGQTSAHELVVP